MVIVAAMGLTVAYLRAEYVLHQGFNAAEHESGSRSTVYSRKSTEAGIAPHREPA